MQSPRATSKTSKANKIRNRHRGRLRGARSVATSTGMSFVSMAATPSADMVGHSPIVWRRTKCRVRPDFPWNAAGQRRVDATSSSLQLFVTVYLKALSLARGTTSNVPPSRSVMDRALTSPMCIAAIESVVLNYVPPLGMVWSRLPLDFLLLLPLGMCTAASLASMVVLIRRTWLLLLLGYTLFILSELANAWARYRFGSLNNLGPLDHDGLEAFFWFPSLIGLGVAWILARRWRKLEIGAIF
jgi:hypothetical protein